MSKSLYKKGGWPIHLDPSWRIKGVNNVLGVLYGSKVILGDVLGEQHFLCKRYAHIQFFLDSHLLLI